MSVLEKFGSLYSPSVLGFLDSMLANAIKVWFYCRPMTMINIIYLLMGIHARQGAASQWIRQVTLLIRGEMRGPCLSLHDDKNTIVAQLPPKIYKKLQISTNIYNCNLKNTKNYSKYFPFTK